MKIQCKGAKTPGRKEKTISILCFSAVPSSKIVAFREDFPWRRFLICCFAEFHSARRSPVPQNQPVRTSCRLQIGDTAECNSALLWLRLGRAMPWRLCVKNDL
jgi:hypothetical protein